MPKISGLMLFPVRKDEGKRVLLSEEDHILRRFGQVDLLNSVDLDSEQFTLRYAADEFWVCVNSTAEFSFVDLRAKSPTEGITDKVSMESSSNEGVLIPFGVAYAIEPGEDAQLIRFTTHADGTHGEDRKIMRGEVKSLNNNS